MTQILNIISHSESETQALAEKLLTVFRPGDVLVLSGELGAGKTVFVRGLAKGLRLDINKVSSPSFTMVNEYEGEKPLYHFDLYRLVDSDELIEIGWDEYLNRGALIAVEWGEKAGYYLPNKFYQIDFKLIDETEREINISFVSKDENE